MKHIIEHHGALIVAIQESDEDILFVGVVGETNRNESAAMTHQFTANELRGLADTMDEVEAKIMEDLA